MKKDDISVLLNTKGKNRFVMEQKEFVPQKLEETILLSKKIVMEEQKDKEAGMLEFVFGQMRFISCGTWMLRVMMFLGMTFVLYAVHGNGREQMDQILSIFTSILVLSGIPEIWKNIRFHATDIEICTRFGLKKAYMARFLLLGMMDLCMATFLAVMGNRWLSVSFYEMAVWFLVPYNSTLMICLSMTAFAKHKSEYLTEAVGALWMAAVYWLTGYVKIYEKVQLFLWGILLVVSCVYIGFVISKIMKSTEQYLEVEYVRD
ncbi:MAG: hypothetical protein J6K58_13020 [Lachnospiraceae bacterium]|nr:hypothetical protein [Lachnospiraceae bacterium]